MATSVTELELKIIRLNQNMREMEADLNAMKLRLATMEDVWEGEEWVFRRTRPLGSYREKMNGS